MENKTDFGKVALILALIYVTGMAISTVWGTIVFVRDYHDFMMSDGATAFLSIFNLLLGLCEIAILIFWLATYWKNAESISRPAMTTAFYFVLRIIYALLNHGLINPEETISAFFEYRWSLFIIATAWAVLRINTQMVNRIIFVILRAIPILILIPSQMRSFSYYAGLVFKPESGHPNIWNVFSLFYIIGWYIVYILFFIWLLKPSLFTKNEELQVD